MVSTPKNSQVLRKLSKWFTIIVQYFNNNCSHGNLELGKRSNLENGLFIALCSKYVYHFSLSVYNVYIFKTEQIDFDP